MKCQVRMVSFLAAWLVAVGGVFWLSSLEALAGDCNECHFCEALNYVSVSVTDSPIYYLGLKVAH